MSRVFAVLSILFFAVACASLTPEQIREAANLGKRDQVVEWLGDSRSWVRAEAARSLGRMRDPSARSMLEERLSDRNEKSWVRAAAAEALGELADPASLPLLAGLAVQPDSTPEVKVALVQALCGFSGEEPLAAIAPLARNEDLLVSALASAKLASECGRVAR